MLVLDLRNREAFVQLQSVYIAALEGYMAKNQIKVLDKLVDLEVEVDSKAQAFRVKDSGLGSRVSYKVVLEADKGYDSDYDIFDYYCKYIGTNKIVLPSYLGYDVTGMLGYFRVIEFDMKLGFKVVVDNYKTNESYLTNYVIPVANKLENYLVEDIRFDNLRMIANLKSLCREFDCSFTIEADVYGGAFRQKNKKRKLTCKQQEVKKSIMSVLNARLIMDVYLFNYIKPSDLGTTYSNRLYGKTIENGKGENGYIVTFIDGGN